MLIQNLESTVATTSRKPDCMFANRYPAQIDALMSLRGDLLMTAIDVHDDNEFDIRTHLAFIDIFCHERC